MRSCNCIKKSNKKNLKPVAATVPETTGNESIATELEYETPLVDIIEDANEFIIIADMPGASPETVDVQYDNGELTIIGEEVVDGETEDFACVCSQFEPGNYFRSFQIGEGINADHISADYSDGVLTVHLPKRAEVQPRKIAVGKKEG